MKGRINSPADPRGGGREREGHRELGKESIASVLGGLLNFFGRGNCLFFFLFNFILKFFLLAYLGFFLTPAKSVMDSAIVPKVYSLV